MTQLLKPRHHNYLYIIENKIVAYLKLTTYLYPFVFYSLMMCGVLAAMFEYYDEAQTFLEQATNIHPPSVVAWTLLGEMDVCISP